MAIRYRKNKFIFYKSSTGLFKGSFFYCPGGITAIEPQWRCRRPRVGIFCCLGGTLPIRSGGRSSTVILLMILDHADFCFEGSIKSISLLRNVSGTSFSPSLERFPLSRKQEKK
jgi:hypothetical protein